MPRNVPEWVGKTPDSKVPPRVLLRIWEREHGICHISKRKIMPGEKWQAEHKIALINGGENRESNIFPALTEPHKIKTREDIAEKAKIAAIKGKHIGAIVPKGDIKGASLPKSAKAARIAARGPRAVVVNQGGLYARIRDIPDEASQ